MSEASGDRPWTDKERFRAAFIEQGKSTTELADEWEASRQTIYRWRKRHGFDQHDGKPWSDEETLREVLVNEGRSPYDLADEWDCYAQTIYTWANKFDIELPSRESPFKDEEFARREYVEKGKSLEELGDEYGYTAGAVKYWLKKHGIERRTAKKDLPPNFRTGKQGYERIRSDDKGTSIHRLVAVAEWGFDAVKDKVVHHKNGCTFDNRHNNLELMTIGEHNTHHFDEKYGDEPWRDKDTLRDAYQGATCEELADRWGCSNGTISNWLREFNITTK